MPDGPKSDGLNLSMITQPVNKPFARERSSEAILAGQTPPQARANRYSGVAAFFAVKGSLRLARLYSDLVDAVIAALVSIGLLVAVFAWGASVIGDSESSRYDELAFILIFTALILGVPMAALLYTCLVYLVTGTTAGKRLLGLRVEMNSGAHPSRFKLTSRSLFKWGPYTALGTIGVATALTMLVRSDGDLSMFETFTIVTVNVIGYALTLTLLVYIFLDQMLPWARSDCRSLTDMLTKTKVVFKDEPARKKARNKLSEV